MKVSVLVMTYNHERFIERALDGALAQEVDFELEIIVSEDRSTDATREIAFMGMPEVRDRIERGGNDLVLLDVREKDAFLAGHLPGAKHLPRGQLELRVDKELPDPGARILTYCQYGRISTLAAATLRAMGYTRAVALDGGYDEWVKQGFPVEQ